MAKKAVKKIKENKCINRIDMVDYDGARHSHTASAVLCIMLGVDGDPRRILTRSVGDMRHNGLSMMLGQIEKVKFALMQEEREDHCRRDFGAFLDSLGQKK